MANLVELFDNIVQMQNLNGVPLAAGKLYVYALGRTRLMDTWSDVDGESLNPNPIILDDAGQAHVYVSDDFDYTLVVCDQYNNEIFSLDKYLFSEGSHSHADVAVAPSEHIGVSSYHVGEVTVYVPYLTGEVGKVYEGIDPIVVNNDVNRISANHIPLGVQDPLYFVEDSETACIIGFSGETIPEGVMSESALGFENNKITGYNGSAFSAGNEYEAGSYVDIDNNTISVTGLQPEGDYAYNSALSSKLDVTALPQDLVHSGDLTAYQPAGNYLSATDSANFYPIDNPSGFITGVDLTDYATTAQLDEKLDKSDSGNFYPMEGNPSGFLTAHQSLQGYATEQWVEDKGYITGVEIPESATWNATTETVSSNSAQWGASNPQIPVTGINGIKISESGDKVVFEVSADYALADDLTGKQDSLTFGYKDTAISSIDNSALYDNSAHARINTLAGRISDLSSNKLDTTAFSDVSGTFLTAHQDLSDYQTTAGMTAYMSTADSAEFMTTAERSDYIPTGVSSEFYTTANTANYISEVPDTYLQNTDLSTTDGKVTAISGIPLSAGGDVPEGVMVESAVEYNAVNEISAYNGSAIAQYGAEKQFIVHDDTLCHLSNSAQYALGVNLSAVAQLLGVDETVLWEGTAMVTTSQNAINLSESMYNFNSIKIYDRSFSNTAEDAFATTITEVSMLPSAREIGTSDTWMDFYNTTASASHYFGRNYYSGNADGTKLVTLGSYIKSINSTAAYSYRGAGKIFKVVGIGRKEA